MMYQPSAGWFYTGNSDPTMVLLPPIAQFGHNTMFITPCSSNTVPLKSFFTLYAEGAKHPDGTPDTVNQAKIVDVLNSIIIREGGASGTQYRVSQVAPSFYTDRIPGTNIYFARGALKSDMVYRIDGKTRFSGSVYGWGNVVSYSWPMSMRLIETEVLDTLPPEVKSWIYCGSRPDGRTGASFAGLPDRPNTSGQILYTGEWADTTNILGGEWADDQIDLGLSKPPFFSDATEYMVHNRYWYDEPFRITSVTWQTGTRFRRGAVDRSVKDIYKDVYVTVRYEDAAGNATVDTIIYIADKLVWLDISGNPIADISFDDAIVGLKYRDTIYLKNIDTIPHTVNCENIFLQSASNTFQIIEGGGTGIEIGPNQQHRIIIAFNPTTAGDFSNTLYAYTTCLYFQLPISGNTISTTFNVKLLVESEDAGTVEGAGDYEKNETVTISATANENYIFKNWTANAIEISTENPYTFILTQDTILTANFEDTVSIAENHLISSIRILPNPVSSEAIIEINSLESQANTVVMILDISGREVLTIYTGLLVEGANNFSLPNNILPNGNYILSVKNKNGQKIEQFVITR